MTTETEYEPKDSIIQRMSARAADMREVFDNNVGTGSDEGADAADGLLAVVEEFLAAKERTLEVATELAGLLNLDPDLQEKVREVFAQQPTQHAQAAQRDHTATTRHLVDVTVTVPGDDGIDPEYLVDVLMWGLEQHNAAVQRLGTKADEDGDQSIQPVAMRASDDIGLGGERAAFCHDPEGTDFTYFGVEGASLRRCDSNDAPSDEDIILKF